MDSHLFTCCGSPAYAAPELVAGKEYVGAEVRLGLLFHCRRGVSGSLISLSSSSRCVWVSYFTVVVVEVCLGLLFHCLDSRLLSCI